MATVTLVDINDGDTIEAAPVNTSFTRLKDEINGGLDNTNILVTRGSPLISGAKIDITTNTIFSAEHNDDGAHTALSNFTYGLRVTNNASTPESQVDVNAYNISLLNEAGTSRKLLGAQVDITAVMQAAASGQNGLDTGSPAPSTQYYLYLVNDSEDTETTLVVFSTQSYVNSTLYANVQANVLPTVTHALQIGTVYRDAEGNLGQARPAISGGFAEVFMPRWVMAATGTYQGTGVAFDVDTVGFKPDYVMIKSTTVAAGAVFRQANHTGSYASTFIAAADATTFITALNWDGFTVGTSSAVNQASAYYTWVAWKVHEGVEL